MKVDLRIDDIEISQKYTLEDVYIIKGEPIELCRQDQPFRYLYLVYRDDRVFPELIYKAGPLAYYNSGILVDNIFN